MFKEALERLIVLLERQPEDQPVDSFNLDSWYDGKDTCPTKYGFKIKAQDCGTSACAVGLAALDPWFQERGLQLVPPDEDEDGDEATIRYQGYYHFSAVNEFFDIPYEEAWRLFHPSGYAIPVTPSLVATNIRNLLQREEGCHV